MNKHMIGEKAPAPLLPLSYANLISGWVGESPVISVLCSTYQHVDCVSRAIDGFLAQRTNFPFEIIIRDDASEDGTREIIEHYVNCYPSIINPIYEENNRFPEVKPGPILRRAARGKYLAFCEGDDYWIDSTRLQLDVELMEANPESVAVSSRVLFTRDGIVTGFGEGGLRGTSCVSRIPIPSCRRKFIHFGDTYQFSILKSHGAFLYREKFTAVSDFNEGGVFKAVVEKDLRKIEYLRSGTQFWLSEYFYERGELGKAAKHLGNSIEVQLRAFPRIAVKALFEFFLGKIRAMLRSSIVGRRILSFRKFMQERG